MSNDDRKILIVFVAADDAYMAQTAAFEGVYLPHFTGTADDFEHVDVAGVRIPFLTLL